MPLDLSYIDRADTRGAFEEPAPRKGIHPILKYGPIATNLLDAITTAMVLRRGGYEMNPLMAPIADNTAALIGTKGLIGLLTGLAADKLYKDGHETMGKVVGGLSLGVPLAYTANNARHLK